MLGRTLQVLGELVIAYIVIKVHGHVIKEHRIDAAVLREMKRERYIGGVGAALIILGFFLELTTNL